MSLRGNLFTNVSMLSSDAISLAEETLYKQLDRRDEARSALAWDRPSFSLHPICLKNLTSSSGVGVVKYRQTGKNGETALPKPNRLE